MSLFSSKTFKINNPAALGKGCGKCQLFRHCNSPKMEPYGECREGLMIIGEAPGQNEDDKGIPFIGKSGQHLDHALRKLGIDVDVDAVKLNAVSCHPNGNRTPNGVEIDACRGRVWSNIEKYKPKVILALGMTALESLIGHRWPKKKDDKETGLGSMARWFNWAIPDRQTNCWIVPCYHPAYILREHESTPAADVWFERALKNAIKHLSIPFPDYKDEEACVEIITDPEIIRKRLLDISYGINLIAYDYETTGLKPYREGHKIWYVGIATGPDEAICFPTAGSREAMRVFRAMMTRPTLGKIAHNIAFEDLWTRERLGVQVQGWRMDTIQAAHVLNQTSGISGLKFQTYVRTGLIDYSSHISDYLSTPLNKEEEKYGDNKFNQISLAPPDEVMKYCGIDCIGTFRLAIQVAKELKIDLYKPV
jgi:DNA polymerase